VLQLRIHGPDLIKLDEIERPEPGPGEAVLRVEACGVCGSDLGYIALGGVAGPRPEPTPLGHEFSAVIDRLGDGVERFSPGQRVVVNPMASGNTIGNGGPGGAFAHEVLVRNVDTEGVLFRIPDELPAELAALTEPLGVGMQAVDRADVSPGDKVTIFGAGPIGLMALAVLKYRGFDDVAIVDLSAKRLELATGLGATLALNPTEGDVWAPIQELHGTELFMDVLPCVGSNAYIEASGAPTVIGDVIGRARPGARISVVALHRQPEPVNFVLLMSKQLTLAGSMCYPDDFGEMVRMLLDPSVDLSSVVTHRFPLSRAEDAIATARDAAVSGKVVVTP
jgi:threonine dehydrogenase-like Zn-dependent dehydrogenase